MQLAVCEFARNVIGWEGQSAGKASEKNLVPDFMMREYHEGDFWAQTCCVYCFRC